MAAIAPPQPPQPPLSLPPLPAANTIVPIEDKTNASPSLAYNVQIYKSSKLPAQSFLPELKAVINASYGAHGANFIGDVGNRLKSDTQLVEELGATGFMAIAFSQGAIIGTAALKPWDAEDGNGFFKEPDDLTGLSVNQILSALPSKEAVRDKNAETVPCDGDLELAFVAVKPDGLYRKRGIAETLVRACEEEAKKMWVVSSIDDARKDSIRINLRVIREINGPYWLKKGFRIIGEKYCPLLTWGLQQDFVVWAMVRELSVNQYMLHCQ